MFVLLCSKCALAFSLAIRNSAHSTYITKYSLYIPSCDCCIRGISRCPLYACNKFKQKQYFFW